MNRPVLEGLRLNTPAYVRHTRLVEWGVGERIERLELAQAAAFERGQSRGKSSSVENDQRLARGKRKDHDDHAGRTVGFRSA